MQIVINILLMSSVILLSSLSFGIIYNTVKFFNFAHAVFFALGAYFTFFLITQLGLPLSIGIVLAVIFTSVIGMCLGYFIFTPLRKNNSNSFIFLVSSLGLYAILQNLISLIWGDDTKTIYIGAIKAGNEFFGAYITNIQIINITVCLILFAGTVLLLKKTKIGQQIRAVSSNEQLANIFGINSDKIILWVFGIGAGIAAVIGVLVAFDTGMTPTMGFNLLLYGVVVMIIGGVGSMWGLAGGALLLATAQHLGAYYVDSKWMNVIAYLILILFLIWKPLGFSGQRLKKTEI